jgi:hypothetical protein
VNDRTLPRWFRLVLIVPAIGQTVFGLTLLYDPTMIGDIWPWSMTPISARILGASTLVSVPLAVLPAVVNRWSAAVIPIVMLLTYRVFQLLAGLIHIDRFDFSQFPTWNYFAGGTALLLIYSYALIRGWQLGRPVESDLRYMPMNLPLRLSAVAKGVLVVLGGVFITLGVLFLYLGPDAGPLWFEAEGELTPLTARLFSSPMIGLALSLLLIARASRWSQVAIPAIGMVTFGIAGSLAVVMEWGNVDPPSAIGYFSAAIAPILLVTGLSLLIFGRAAIGAMPEPARCSEVRR